MDQVKTLDFFSADLVWRPNGTAWRLVKNAFTHDYPNGLTREEAEGWLAGYKGATVLFDGVTDGHR